MKKKRTFAYLGTHEIGKTTVASEAIKCGLSNVSGSYVVFEYSHEHEALVQLSVTLPTLERAREHVKGWKSKKLYIYLLVE